MSQEIASPFELFLHYFNDAFSEEELRTLCFELNIGEYESLAATGKANKARELIRQCQREGRLLDLVRYCQRKRDRIRWPSLEDFLAVTRHGREAPPLLPYMVDRVEQEIQLEKAIKQLTTQANTKPFVCVVYGERKQGHDSFIDRLKETLPEKLNAITDETAVPEYPLRLPSPLTNMGELPQQMQERLSHVVLGTSTGSIQHIHTKLINHRAPIIIHSRISGEDWRQHQLSLVERYIQFWQEWPVAAGRQNIFVFLIIRYRPEKKGRFVIFGKQPVQEQIKQALSQYQTQTSKQIPFAILPELTSIAERQVEEWVELKETQSFCKMVGLTDNLIRNKIHRFYEKWEQEFQTTTIPLDAVAEELTNILNSNLSQV